MGKHSTGAQTVYGSIRLELKFLQTNGYIRDGGLSSGTLQWSSNGEVTARMGVNCWYTKGGQGYVRLTYTTTDAASNKIDHCYKINLVEVPSNLGTGSVLYMECPQTGKLCRILYIAYGSLTFKCREAYTTAGKRLYYDCQIASQLSRYNDNYWRIEKHLEDIGTFRREYAGKETKTYARVQRLWEKQAIMDHERWLGRGLPVSLSKVIF